MQNQLVITVVRKMEDYSFVGYKWTAVCKYNGQVPVEKSGETNSGLSLNQLFEDLVSHFGGELKNRERDFEILVKTKSIEIMNQSYPDNKYYCYSELKENEALALTKALNDLVKNPNQIRPRPDFTNVATVSSSLS